MCPHFLPDDRGQLRANTAAGEPFARFILLVPGVIDAGVILPGGEIEQSGHRAERRRIPVRPALHSRIGQGAFGGRHSLFDGDGTAALVETRCPGLLHERAAQQKLAGASVQHIEKAVAIAPKHRLARLPFPVQIGEHGNLHRVVIEAVMRRELKMPFQFAGVGVERHHRIGIEVVAVAQFRIPIGAGISNAPIREIQLRIVRAGEPDRCAAVHARNRPSRCRARARRAREWS